MNFKQKIRGIKLLEAIYAFTMFVAGFVTAIILLVYVMQNFDKWDD